MSNVTVLKPHAVYTIHRCFVSSYYGVDSTAPAVLRTLRLLRAHADAPRRRGSGGGGLPAPLPLALPPLLAAASVSLRVYLQRDPAPSREHNDNAAGRGRRVRNEEAVAAALRQAGYVTLRLGRASLIEKAAALRAARRVVTPVGASALNLLFASGGGGGGSSGGAGAALWLFADPAGAGAIGAHWTVCVAAALWAEPPRAFVLRAQPGVSTDGVDVSLLRAAVARLDAGGEGAGPPMLERLECDRTMTTTAPSQI